MACDWKGIENDANEHMMFWLEVARALIRANFAEGGAHERR